MTGIAEDGTAVCAPDAVGGSTHTTTEITTEVPLMPCDAGKILRATGSSWECSDDLDTQTTYTAGAGVVLSSENAFSIDPTAFDGYLQRTGDTMSGALSIVSSVGSSKAPGLVLRNEAGGGGARVGIDFSTYGANVSAAIEAADTNYSSDLVFSTRTAGPGNVSEPAAERMRIQTDGDVGIGTTDPQRKLDVNGIARATSFEGSGSGLTNITRSTNTTRVVFGMVASDGSTSGVVDGWSVTRASAGRYVISFSPSFSSNPAVTFTQLGGTIGYQVIEGISFASVTVQCYAAGTGTPTDTLLNFIAVGRN